MDSSCGESSLRQHANALDGEILNPLPSKRLEPNVLEIAPEAKAL
jgi:hypothetical protein